MMGQRWEPIARQRRHRDVTKPTERSHPWRVLREMDVSPTVRCHETGIEVTGV